MANRAETAETHREANEKAAGLGDGWNEEDHGSTRFRRAREAGASMPRKRREQGMQLSYKLDGDRKARWERNPRRQRWRESSPVRKRMRRWTAAEWRTDGRNGCLSTADAFRMHRLRSLPQPAGNACRMAPLEPRSAYATRRKRSSLCNLPPSESSGKGEK